nr:MULTISPECIES: hypothetical protein [unclassified Mesorhizobium]
MIGAAHDIVSGPIESIDQTGGVAAATDDDGPPGESDRTGLARFGSLGAGSATGSSAHLGFANAAIGRNDVRKVDPELGCGLAGFSRYRDLAGPDIGRAGFPDNGIRIFVDDFAKRCADRNEVTDLDVQQADSSCLRSINFDCGLGGLKHEKNCALFDPFTLCDPNLDELEIVLVGVNPRGFDKHGHVRLAFLEQVDAGRLDGVHTRQQVVLPVAA